MLKRYKDVYFVHPFYFDFNIRTVTLGDCFWELALYFGVGTEFLNN